MTVHMDPEQIVAGLRLDFLGHISAADIETCVERLRARLKTEVL